MSLLDKLKKLKKGDKEYKCICLGLDGSGKTTFLKHAKELKFSNTTPTKKFEISKIYYEDVQLNAWDLGGEKTIRPFWQHYYASLDIVLWFIDCSDKSRFQESLQSLTKVLEDPKIPMLPLLIVCNKQDLANAMPASDVSFTIS
eukprot:jgi/Bigna1/42881/e_gw1.68.78.1